MEIDWDEAKRLRNIAKHGFDFLWADEVLLGNHVEIPACYENEERFLAVGKIKGRFATVIYTIRDGRYRIISLRSARHEERQRYHTHYP